MGLHRQYFLVVLSSALFLGGPVCGSQQRHSGGSGGEGEGEGEGGDEGEGEGSGEGEGEGSTGSGRQGDPCATSADCRQFYWCIAGRCALTTDLWADGAPLPEAFDIESLVLEDYRAELGSVPVGRERFFYRSTGTVLGIRIQDLHRESPANLTSVKLSGTASIIFTCRSEGFICPESPDGGTVCDYEIGRHNTDVTEMNVPCTVNLIPYKLQDGQNAYRAGIIDQRRQGFEYWVDCSKSEGNSFLSVVVHSDAGCHGTDNGGYRIYLNGGVDAADSACFLSYPPDFSTNGAPPPEGLIPSVRYVASLRGPAAEEWPLIDHTVNMRYPAACGDDPW